MSAASTQTSASDVADFNLKLDAFAFDGTASDLFLKPQAC